MKTQHPDQKAPADWLSVQSVGLVLLTLALIVGVLGYINQHPEGFTLDTFLGDFYANISAELSSIAITVLIIDTLYRRRERQTEVRREREHLIRQLGSGVNEVAKHAAETLRAEGWLTDGSLQETDLRVANLEEAKLWEADLQGVNLQWAKLKKANLNRVNLVGANLVQANLQAARMRGSDLRGANLLEARLYRVQFHDANLEEANLSGAHLEGAQFFNAYLGEVNVDGAFFDELTIMPDGEFWTPETDVTRFTDPNHPEFWRPSAANVTANADDDNEYP
ncbi:MAG: pentapeptide repeat-containing protein [Chloroflexi bacterium]|nr:pentapeptide repeat-containing protein [Chloroflexota bacterium]